MRTARWAIGLAVLGVLLAQVAQAQTTRGFAGADSGLTASAETEGDQDYALAPGSEGKMPPAPPTSYYTPGEKSPEPPSIEPSATTAAAPQNTGTTCCECPPPVPWKVPQPCCFQNMGITWGGWTQMGATVNGWNPPSHFNGPLATNDRNEFELNQFWVYFDRPVNTEERGWDVGGHVDLVYGTDWRFGRSYGLESQIDSPNCLYGLVLPQHYLTVGIQDLTIKMGHYTPGFGYEAIPAPANFFYSHSYAMCYSEPILVTGLQGDYKLSDQWTLTAGFNRGWMMYEDNNDSLDVVAGIHWTTEDKETQVAFMLTNGPQDANGDNNRCAYSFVVQQQLGERWQYVIQHNLGVEDGTSYVVPGGQALWCGIDQYLFYKINDKWKAGLRVEWFEDADGTRVAGIGNWIGSNRGWTALPGFAGDFYEVTLGLNYRPCPNFVFRPELRWDWYDGTRNLQGQLPFDDGLKASQFTAAVDMVVTF